MKRHHAVGAAMVGFVAITAVAVLVIVAGGFFGGARAGGPLGDTPAFGYAVTIEVGEEITDAMTLLALDRDAGDLEVELIKIEQVFPSDALSSAGEWIAGEDRSREAAVVQQYYPEAPPTDPRLGQIGEVEGTRVVSRDVDAYGTQLLLGVAVRREGHFLRDGLWVTYRYEGSLYRDLIPAKLTICTPTAVQADGTCLFLGDED